MGRLSGASLLSRDQIQKVWVQRSDLGCTLLFCLISMYGSGWNTVLSPLGTMPYTSFPAIMELEGDYLLTKQAETTVPDILLKYFNFPRNPEKIIPWDSIVNEGMTFQFPSLEPSDQQKWITTHLALLRGALAGRVVYLCFGTPVLVRGWPWVPFCPFMGTILEITCSFWN